MEQYKIKIFKSAQKDLEEIVDYLNTLSHETAIKYYDLIIDEISSLSTMPMRCGLVQDIQLKVRGYRILQVKNYLVFFIITGDTIQIHRILYNRRQYNDFL